jgi:hypothetical protein
VSSHCRTDIPVRSHFTQGIVVFTPFSKPPPALVGKGLTLPSAIRKAFDHKDWVCGLGSYLWRQLDPAKESSTPHKRGQGWQDVHNIDNRDAVFTCRRSIPLANKEAQHPCLVAHG